MRGDHADRAAARRAAAPRARCARRSVRVTPGRPRGRRAPSRRARCARARARGRSSSSRPRDVVRPTSSGALAGGGDEAQLVRPGRERDDDEPRVEQLAQPPRDEVEQPVEVGLASRARCRPRSATRAGATSASPPRTAARSRSRPRPGAASSVDELLVLLGEVLAAGLLGQVEVAVGDAAQQDRHAEERAHRRMVRREADRARVLRDQVVEPQRPRRRGSARRGSRGRAAGRRSRRASRRRCPS